MANSNVECKSIADATHLDPSVTVQADYTPYGDFLLGTKWGPESVDCRFGSLHYWNSRTLYIDGVDVY